MMALMCLCMMTNVTTQNITIQLSKLILMSTDGVQTNVGDEEDFIIIPMKKKTLNQL
jgi:hypothetical protein